VLCSPPLLPLVAVDVEADASSSSEGLTEAAAEVVTELDMSRDTEVEEDVVEVKDPTQCIDLLNDSATNSHSDFVGEDLPRLCTHPSQPYLTR
jgi:hypothetical protein